MPTNHTQEQWRTIGRQMGRERGQLDSMAGMVQPVERLWIPDGVDDAYVEGLHEGYLEIIAGTPAQLGV